MCIDLSTCNNTDTNNHNNSNNNYNKEILMKICRFFDGFSSGLYKNFVVGRTFSKICRNNCSIFCTIMLLQFLKTFYCSKTFL